MKRHWQNIKHQDLNIDILRLDILKPEIQGNKYYKLKYNIVQAKQENKSYLLSFGGEYSNHISALSFAGKKHQLKTIGIIRTENTNTSTLQYAANNGMRFYIATRTEYRELRKALKENMTTKIFDFISSKDSNTNICKANTYLIPEGGTNTLALKGTQEILNDSTKNFDYICVPVGTGGTISGIIASAQKNTKIIGFAALKGNFFEKEIIHQLQSIEKQDCTNWQILNEYHFGAYAAFNNELINFINEFYKQHHIKLDPIYNAKMFYGLFDLIQKNTFKAEDKILAIYTGGLQGIEGFNQKHANMLIF